MNPSVLNAKIPSPRTWSLWFFCLLILAGTGQFFLAQKDVPWTLWVGIWFYLLSLPFLFKVLYPLQSTRLAFEQEPPLPIEGILFTFILFIAVFLRVYKINEVPDGVFADRAEVALGALRILHGQWHPFLEALSQHVPELCVYYLAAGWFWLFGSSPEIFSYFDVFLSTAGVVFAYAVFRQLSGPRIALTAFFLLAVLRWNFVFAHQIYFQSQTVFFSMLALAVFLYALRRNRSWLFAAAGFFLALGLYSYQALKAFPLYVLACALFEFWKDRAEFRKNFRHWIVLGLAFLCSVAPLFVWIFQNDSLGRREPEVSIFHKIQEARNWTPLTQNLTDNLQALNRRHDTNSQSDFQGRRLLDDFTGTLLVLALIYGISKIKKRSYFYAVAGMAVMDLPCLLSENGAHAGRMLGMTPFIAYLLALVLFEWRERWNGVFVNRREVRLIGAGLFICFLGLAAFHNFKTYFYEQIRDSAYLNDFSWPESQVGKIIAGDSGKTAFFLSSRFYGHPTVDYLANSRLTQVHTLDLSQPPLPRDYPPGTDFCFFVDELKMGTLNFLIQLYPGGEVVPFPNPLGQVPLYAYRVSAEALNKVGAELPKIRRGLYGIYSHSDQADDNPFLKRWDPVINFTFRDLPLNSSPLWAHWNGRFLVSQAGLYDFLVLTYETSQARLVIDGAEKTDFIPQPSEAVRLKKGWHRLDLLFFNPSSAIATVNLLWKKPGQEKYEFVPNEDLGLVH